MRKQREDRISANSENRREQEEKNEKREESTRITKRQKGNQQEIIAREGETDKIKEKIAKDKDKTVKQKQEKNIRQDKIIISQQN